MQTSTSQFLCKFAPHTSFFFVIVLDIKLCFEALALCVGQVHCRNLEVVVILTRGMGA